MAKSKIKNQENNKYQQGCEGKGTLLTAKSADLSGLTSTYYGRTEWTPSGCALA